MELYNTGKDVANLEMRTANIEERVAAIEQYLKASMVESANEDAQKR